MHVAGCCWIENACCRLLLDRECMLHAAVNTCCRLLLDRECMLQAAAG